MLRAWLAALVAALTVVGLGAAPASAYSTAAAPAAAAQTLTWTADDSITAYASAPTSAVAGATTIVFENSEATGNTTGMTHTLTFDTSTPGYNHDVSLNIVASPFDANGGRHEAQVTLTPGTYRYFCSIPGHSQMVGEFTVTGGGEDTTPPTVTAEISGEQDADGNYVGSATVTVTATDEGSGVASVEYEVDDTGFQPYTGPVTVSTPGDHAVQYRATDAAGNVSGTGSVPFRVVADGDDTTPPTVTAEVSGEQDSGGNYVDSATVTLSATDSGSGVASVEYSVDGGAFTPYTAPVVVDTPGEHMVHYRATDVAGNVSPEGMTGFTVVEQDTIAPTVSGQVTGEQDADGNYLGSAVVTVTAADDGSGVASVEYSVDGGAFAPYTEPVQVGAAGEHTVTFRATDVAGNVSEPGSVSFTVVDAPGEDTTPPSVSAVVSGQQDANWNYLDSATLTIDALDADSGVASVEYQLDGGDWTAYTEPVTVGTPGEHTVTYRATDNAGNVSAELSGGFTIVESAGDQCPGSDTRPTVVIGVHDTGVPNVDTGNGCTVNDVIAEDAEYGTHNAFVRHVNRVTDELVGAGVITSHQRSLIVDAAIASDVGKRARFA